MLSIIPQILLIQFILGETNSEYTEQTVIPEEATRAYAVTEVYPQDCRLYSRLHIFHWWENFDHYSKVQENYIAEVNLRPAASGQKEGAVELKNLNAMFDDEIHDHSWFWPIGSTGAGIQLTNTWLFGGQVRLADPGHEVRQTLQVFRAGPGDESYGAVAVSRSGSLILAALADEVRIGDPLKWSKTTREEGPLWDLRRYLAVSMGNPGQWFLTNDGRYVVVVPVRSPQHVFDGGYSEGGKLTPTTKPASLSAVEIGENANAFIYDRTEKKFTTCPRELKYAKMVDAESVNGKLQLVYAKDNSIEQTAEIPELHRRDTITVADTTGNILYEHQTVTLKTYILYAGWDPKQERLWFRVRDAQYHSIDDDVPTEQPQADYHLMVWDRKTNSEQQWRLSVAEIKKAIDRLPGNKAGR